MSAYVEAEIVPVCVAQGFALGEHFLGDPSSPISPNEIYLEMKVNDYVDYVDLTFAQYGLPRFQVGFARREAGGRNAFVQRGNLVSHSRQYYHFWGKPWWMPLGLWTDDDSKRVVVAVSRRLVQVFRCLDSGERGPNISKPI